MLLYQSRWDPIHIEFWKNPKIIMEFMKKKPYFSPIFFFSFLWLYTIKLDNYKPRIDETSEMIQYERYVLVRQKTETRTDLCRAVYTRGRNSWNLIVADLYRSVTVRFQLILINDWDLSWFNGQFDRWATWKSDLNLLPPLFHPLSLSQLPKTLSHTLFLTHSHFLS